MTLPNGLGVFSVMAASFCLSWLRLATSSSARFGAASPTQLCERFTTSSVGAGERAPQRRWQFEPGDGQYLAGTTEIAGSDTGPVLMEPAVEIAQKPFIFISI